MASKQIKYITSSFAWVTISKILDAAVKFFTIPLLIHYFGKENYGLLTLAIAINAYMQLLDLGMNTGAIKFFSQWISLKKYVLINKVARTNISFYLIIGFINSIILIIFGFFGQNIFEITTEQFETFRVLLFILAAFSIVSWVTFAFNQLLVADEKIGFTQQMLSLRSILGLVIVFITIHFSWSIEEYFLSYLIINVSILIPYIFVCKKKHLIKSILPAFYWQDFSIVLKYSIAIFVMSFFQFTATQSRPLILGMFSPEGIGILSEYRIIEVFPLFIVSIGGMFSTIFLPKSAQYIQNKDRKSIEKLAYSGTLYTSILICFLCFPTVLASKELLFLYVGSKYQNLSIWLSLWLFTLTLFLHNTPIASLVLASGKTKMLVYSSAISCIISIIINIILCKSMGVGSAVIGYLIYIIIQMLFYYFYFNKKVLGLNSMQVFKSFFKPFILGFFIYLVVVLLHINLSSAWNINERILMGLQGLIKISIWGVIYITLLFSFRIIDINLLKNKVRR